MKRYFIAEGIQIYSNGQNWTSKHIITGGHYPTRSWAMTLILY